MNILLYASDSASPYHERARSFPETCIRQEELFYLAWPAVMSYLRIATHPSLFDRPLTHHEAMANVETLLNLPHTRFLGEEDGFWGVYRADREGTHPGQPGARRAPRSDLASARRGEALHP